MRTASTGAAADSAADGEDSTVTTRPGQNPTNGAVVYYQLASADQKVKLEFLAPDGSVIKSYESADSASRAAAGCGSSGRRAARWRWWVRWRWRRPPRAANAAGLNHVRVGHAIPGREHLHRDDLLGRQHARPDRARGHVHGAHDRGRRCRRRRRPSSCSNDPRTTATAADLVAQFEFLMKVRDKTSEANDAVKTIRNVKAQLADRAEKAPRLKKSADALAAALSKVEQEVYQVKNQSGQDPLNYPVKLNNKIAGLERRRRAQVRTGPTDQAEAVFVELSDLLGVQLKQMEKLLKEDLEKFNSEAKRAGLEAVVPKAEEPPPKPVITADGCGGTPWVVRLRLQHRGKPVNKECSRKAHWVIRDATVADHPVVLSMNNAAVPAVNEPHAARLRLAREARGVLPRAGGRERESRGSCSACRQGSTTGARTTSGSPRGTTTFLYLDRVVVAPRAQGERGGTRALRGHARVRGRRVAARHARGESASAESGLRCVPRAAWLRGGGGAGVRRTG